MAGSQFTEEGDFVIAVRISQGCRDLTHDQARKALELELTDTTKDAFEAGGPFDQWWNDGR